MQLEHGCRSEYGPLVLRIETTTRVNGFVLYVEDPRKESVMVFEHAELSTLECAKDDVVLHADEYLNGNRETTPGAPEWRCS
jgi:hypothetical protein